MTDPATTPPPTPAVAHPPNLDPQGHYIDLILSTLLRTGVVVSILIIILGTGLSFVHHPNYLHSAADDLKRLTNPGEACPRTLPDIITGLRAGRGQALVAVGLILLIATPIMRVAVSIGVFLYQRDHIFVIITTVVLLLLLLSFVLGKVE